MKARGLLRDRSAHGHVAYIIKRHKNGGFQTYSTKVLGSRLTTGKEHFKMTGSWVLVPGFGRNGSAIWLKPADYGNMGDYRVSRFGSEQGLWPRWSYQLIDLPCTSFLQDEGDDWDIAVAMLLGQDTVSTLS